METENIERIIDKSEEEVKQEQNEDEKSINEEEEEMEENNEENNQQEKDNNQLGDQYQENIQDSTQDNIKEEENINKQEDQYQELADPYATSTYILKYKRTEEELKELAVETNLAKSENCLFMLNIKLIKGELSENGNSNIENDKEKESEEFLVICCHEIAAIYFDEIYERIYTLDDLYKENKFFRVFEKIDEARSIIDESIRRNEKNSKKIFINFKDKELKLHMKLSFFDKEKEIILNIPKKILTDKDKNNLLPEFLKEIQDKLNHLKEENKKLKERKLLMESNRGGRASDFLIESDVKKEKEQEKEKEKESEKEKEKEKDKEAKPSLMEENLEIKDSGNNAETKSLKKKMVKKKKIKKKSGKESDKKNKSPEENFF
jgi:hypothetical protein